MKDHTMAAKAVRTLPMRVTPSETSWLWEGSSQTKATRKSNSAQMKPLQPSNELAAVVGSSPLPRAEVVSRVWEYIKGHQLQNPQNKREILANAKLQAVFGGKSAVSMFEMNKHLAQHLS